LLGGRTERLQPVRGLPAVGLPENSVEPHRISYLAQVQLAYLRKVTSRMVWRVPRPYAIVEKGFFSGAMIT
jgi:hypothetical protein